MRTRGTVGKLRELIANLPDDTPLLVPSLDHSYRPADVQVATARYADYVWSEDDEHLGRQVTALIVF